jgi:hypothetical protein
MTLSGMTLHFRAHGMIWFVYLYGLVQPGGFRYSPLGIFLGFGCSSFVQFGSQVVSKVLVEHVTSPLFSNCGFRNLE